MRFITSPIQLALALSLALLLPLVAGTAAAQEPAADEVAAHEHVALEKEPFTMERFEALQEEGALILVDVFADWCGTCAIQQEVLARFREEHPEIPFHQLTVDFDAQKKYVRHFRAPRQSTLILYQGGEQVWFSVAETSAEKISAAIKEAALAL